MLRRVLDTSILIDHWRAARPTTPEVARAWARKLIAHQDTDGILYPVHIEFVAGVRNSEELRLAVAYLGEFRILDEGRILKQDWELARRLAARVPRDGKPRQLGDCLIRAIARRMVYEVRSLDKRFTR